MIRKYLFYVLIILINTTRLMANEDDRVVNAIYLVPLDSCEFITQGKAHFLQDNLFVGSYTQFQRSVDITYFDQQENFSCYFHAGRGEVLQPGKYINAERISKDRKNPELNASGFGRGYNYSLGEFEVFEIEYDENGKLISFAADFELYNKFRGAVRFNSSYPVDEYFTRMIDPTPNLDSQQLVYIKKRKRNFNFAEWEDVLVLDKGNLSASINRSPNGILKINIAAAGSCHFKDQIEFSIPMLFDEENKEAIYRIQPKLYYENWSTNDDFDELWSDTIDKPQPTINIERRQGAGIFASEGFFKIHDFIYDFKNNKIISLSINFLFKDNQHTVYEGIVRFNTSSMSD